MLVVPLLRENPAKQRDALFSDNYIENFWDADPSCCFLYRNSSQVKIQPNIQLTDLGWQAGQDLRQVKFSFSFPLLTFVLASYSLKCVLL
jgi:hypothetical protein